MTTLIIGGQHVGRIIAERLAIDDLVLLDPDARVIERAEANGVSAQETSITDRRALGAQGATNALVAVVATDRDSTNLLIAQLLRLRFRVPQIIVRINDPQNRSSFEALGVETVCSAEIFADAVSDHLSTARRELIQ